MKRIPDSYASLTRIERMSYAALSILLLILIVIWQTMPYWLPQPSDNETENAKLAALYNDYKKAHPAAPETVTGSTYNQENISGELFAFDPNTLDSAGFIRLGLSPKAVKGLMNWRNHGKKFYKKEDFKPLYNLTPEMYARLEPYISIITTGHDGNQFTNSYAKLPPLPATLDLNKTDSATLVRLNGIGPTLAHKIIERRKALGGFLNHKQLMDVYKFSDSTLTMLQQKLIIHPEGIKKIPINAAGIETLQSHPYIGEKMAKNIILYRNALKRFDNITQIRQVPLMNEEIYRKIAPYLEVD